MDKIRVLIAEDHEIVREGLKMIVAAQDDLEVVGEVGDGREAVRLARELKPDIILMDVSMPELNGLLAAAKLKRVAPDIKILTLTRHTDAAYLQELLRAGVSGYVLKQSAASELLRAIRAVASGGKYLDPAITSVVFADYAGKNKTLRGETRGVELSEREREVLRGIAWGFSNKEIADKMDISVKTVEAHKAAALQKLGIRRRNDIVRYAILQGWLQEN